MEQEYIELASVVDEINLMGVVHEDDVTKLARRAYEQYEVDEASREKWVEAYDKGMEMALQVKKDKSYPFSGCSNVIFPMITTASIQFAARAYPGIFPNRDIVKAKVIGDDSGVFQVSEDGQQAEPVELPGAKANRAGRVARFMSWQLLEQMENWQDDTDSMLHNLPVSGCVFRKIWWDGGPQSKYCTGRDVVVNNSAPNLEKAPQITEIFELYPHEVYERAADGRFDADAVKSVMHEGQTEPVELLEAHVRYDLDGDGLPEPYVVVMTKNGGQPLRVAANYTAADIQGDALIQPRKHYQNYNFIPNPDGSFYGIGFGWLLGPLNSEVNTAINQLNDAAHWQNSKSGFIGKRLKLRAGDQRFRPGEWKPVDTFGETIKNELVPLDFGGPSPTTFNLLSLMINAAQDISSVKDVMMGETSTNLAPTTILTLVEQGSKQFVAIYKRIHRALHKEMRMLFQMNNERIEDIFGLYKSILDDEQASPEDFRVDMDVLPVTDPDMVTSGAAMAKASLVMELSNQGRVDREAATKRVLEAANIENPEELALKQAPPDPDVMVKMAKLENDRARIEISARKVEAEIVKMQTEALHNIAQAESEEQGRQLEMYAAQLGALREMIDGIEAVQGMAEQPSDGGVLPSAGGVPQGAPSGVGGMGAQQQRGMPQPGLAEGVDPRIG